MGTWLDTLLEYLVRRLWRLMAAKVLTRLDLELAAAQAELLSQAEAWRREHGELGEPTARRLELASERLEREFDDYGVAGSESIATLSKPTARNKTLPGVNAVASGKRGRGRPKKEEAQETVGAIAQAEVDPARELGETLRGNLS